MVSKNMKFKGSALADRLGVLNNFICNDEDNLKWNLPTDYDAGVGEAENRFLITESISPLWNKVTINYKKTAVYGSHDGTIQVYGMDNLGLETLLYETKINATETGDDNQKVIDMLKSACTGAIWKDENLNKNTVKHDSNKEIVLQTPLLSDKYDDVSLNAVWYDTAWTKRKGIPVHVPYQRQQHASYPNDPDKVYHLGSTIKFLNSEIEPAYDEDYWYFIINITYDSDMQASFEDLRFCGFDGKTLVSHTILEHVDSTSAKVLVRVPWYFGYRFKEVNHFDKVYPTVGGEKSLTTEDFDNQEPQYIWMYYGNASCADGQTVPSTDYGTVWYDNFDDTSLNSAWTPTTSGVGSSVTETGTELKLHVPANTVGTATVTRTLNNLESYDLIFKLTDIPTSSGNYDAKIWIGTDWNNSFVFWIDHDTVFVGKRLAGVQTLYAGAGQDIAHNDIEPLFVRIRVHRGGWSAYRSGITWSISRDGIKWTKMLTLYETTDIDATVFNNMNTLSMELATWAAAPAFETSMDFDYAIQQRTHEAIHRYDEFEDHFDFGTWSYIYTGSGYADGSTYTASYANSVAAFYIDNDSRIYGGGSANPVSLRFDGLSVLPEMGDLVIETKLTYHARAIGNTLSKAGLSLWTDANKHFDIVHQKYYEEQYNDEIRTTATFGGVDNIKYEGKYGNSRLQGLDAYETLAETPVFLRLVMSYSKKMVIAYFSRNGRDWKQAGYDSIVSFNDSNEPMLFLSNGGSGYMACDFDYIRVSRGLWIEDYGNTLTAEQSVTDYVNMTPESTIYYKYTDDFEDSPTILNYVGSTIALAGSYTNATTGFAANGAGTSIGMVYTTDVPRIGTAGLYCTTAATNGHGVFTQEITIPSGGGKTVNARMWLKAAAAGRAFRLIIEEYTAAGAAITSSYADYTTTGTGWESVDYSVALNANTRKVRLAMYQNSATAQTFYIDEISLVIGSAYPTADSVPYVMNPLSGALEHPGRTYPYRKHRAYNACIGVVENSLGAEILAENQSTFETGVGGVTGVNATVTQSNTTAHGGTYSAKVVPNGASTDSYIHVGGDSGAMRLGMTAGSWYTLTGWFYAATSAISSSTGMTSGRLGRPVVFIYDGATHREYNGPCPTAAGVWQYFEMPFYVPTYSTQAFIRLYCGTNSASDIMYWDDLSLKPGLTPLTGDYSGLAFGTGEYSPDRHSACFENPYTHFTYRVKVKPIWARQADAYPGLYSIPLISSGGSGSETRLVHFTSAGNEMIDLHLVYGTTVQSAGVNTQLRTGGLQQREYDWVFWVSPGRIVGYLDGVEVFDKDYRAAATAGWANSIPGHFTGLPSPKIYTELIYDDVEIRPGFWTVNHSTDEWTDVTMDNIDAMYGENISDYGFLYDPEDITLFRMPSTYVRNQPMEATWKEQGQSTDNIQSKIFYPKNGGTFSLGPDGLDKYIGMKTKILFEGDDEDELEIMEIGYDYTV